MTWDKPELQAAASRWGHVLQEAGRSEADAESAVGTVLDFLDWLPPVDRHLDSVPRTPPPDAGSPGAEAIVPSQVRQLLTWVGTRQRPRQPGIPWPRDRWRQTFPDLMDLFASLPDLLDRETVKKVARRAHEDDQKALEAFVTVMAWGFGNVGYGPYRSKRIIDSTRGSISRLHRVAQALEADGAIAAYDLFRTSCRLAWLGPAFGTKFLYFAQPERGAPKALIHDALVTAWLERQLGIGLSSLGWDTATYRRYLDLAADWARHLGCEPEDIEYAMFAAMANERGSQWATAGSEAHQASELGLPDWVRNLPSPRETAPTAATWEGQSWRITTYQVPFRAMYPTRSVVEWRAHWPEEYGKPMLIPEDGDGPSVGEFEVVKAMRAAGWSASWTDAFGSAPEWMREWKEPEPPSWVMRRVREIQHAVPRAKPWDVWAWRGKDEVSFIEFKGLAEKLTDAELRFLYGAMKTGGAISTFAIVRGDVVHPERPAR